MSMRLRVATAVIVLGFGLIAPVEPASAQTANCAEPCAWHGTLVWSYDDTAMEPPGLFGWKNNGSATILSDGTSTGRAHDNFIQGSCVGETDIVVGSGITALFQYVGGAWQGGVSSPLANRMLKDCLGRSQVYQGDLFFFHFSVVGLFSACLAQHSYPQDATEIWGGCDLSTVRVGLKGTIAWSFAKPGSEFHVQDPSGPPVEDPVGTVTELVGGVDVIRADGTHVSAIPGTLVAQGDIIETSKTGAVNITFQDGSTFAISENSRMSVDAFVYHSQDHTGHSFFSVLQGIFVYTSGLIGKSDSYENKFLNTPVGALGIRGTEFVAHVDPIANYMKIDLAYGEVGVTPKLTDVTTVLHAPQTAVFNSSENNSTSALTDADYNQSKAQITSRLGSPPVDVPEVPWAPLLLLSGGSVLAVTVLGRRRYRSNDFT